MPEIARSALLLAAVAAALAGLDVALGVVPGQGFGPLDGLVAFLIGLLCSVALVWPTVILAIRVPERADGIALGALLSVYALPMVRFGPLVNAPMRSPEVLASIVLVPAILLGAGFAISPFLAPLSERVRATPFAVAALAVLVACVRLAIPDAPATAAGPSLVLITLDTTRPDRMSAYGGPQATPAFDEIASTGARFDLAIAAAPQTGPSHLSLLTGDLPMTTGIVSNGTPIGDQPASLARALRARGWATAAFVAAFPVHPRYGFDQGFDVYDADFSPLPGLHELAPIRLFDLFVLRNLPRERRGDQVVDRAVKWVDRTQGPFFLWVHLYDAHGPYTAPDFYEVPPTDGPPLALPGYWPADQRRITDPAFLERAYDAEIGWTDAQVARLVAELPENTVIVVVADHGESLVEHDVLFDHGDHLYDAELRVPLAIRGPGVTPGTVVSAQVSSVDVAPTALALLGVDDGLRRDGVSRAADLRGEPGPDDDAFASTVAARHEDPPVDHVLRRRDIKCWRTGDPPGLHVYELSSDPGENSPRAGTASDPVCAELDARLAFAAKIHAGDADAETRSMLEQLGYTDPQ